MRVTNLTQQIKNPNRVNIFIDGKYGFSLTVQQVLDEKIKIEAELSDQDIERLKKASADGKIKARMIEWLGLRPHSEKELKDYLKRKEVESSQITNWVLEVQKYGYQNNEQFARWWVEQRRRKGRSSQFITQELRQKGVNQEVITAALQQDESQEESTLKQLIAKKQSQTRFQDKRKLTEYLLRQGYRYSDIVDALGE